MNAISTSAYIIYTAPIGSTAIFVVRGSTSDEFKIFSTNCHETSSNHVQKFSRTISVMEVEDDGVEVSDVLLVSRPPRLEVALGAAAALPEVERWDGGKIAHGIYPVRG